MEALEALTALEIRPLHASAWSAPANLLTALEAWARQGRRTLRQAARPGHPGLCDHVRGVKGHWRGIAGGVASCWSKQRIEEEIAKCDVARPPPSPPQPPPLPQAVERTKSGAMFRHALSFAASLAAATAEAVGTWTWQVCMDASDASLLEALVCGWKGVLFGAIEPTNISVPQSALGRPDGVGRNRCTSLDIETLTVIMVRAGRRSWRRRERWCRCRRLR